MVNPTAVFQRHKNLNRATYREVIYCQTFRNLGQGSEATAQQTFPGGAIILGIRAGAVLAGDGMTLATAAAQAARNRQCFALSLSSSAEGIVIGGPAMADALLGGGDGTDFPSQEIIVPSNGTLSCTVRNLILDPLEIHVVYQCLTPRLRG